MEISKLNKRIILWEIIFPMILLVLGIYNGLMQTLYRSGIIQSSSFLGIEYYQGLTLHGVINAVVLTTFFAVAFGNALIIYYLKKDLNVTVNVISFLMMLGGTVTAAIPILTGDASVLYTFYPPLKAHPAFYIGVTMLVLGSWVAFFGWIPMYLKWRYENKKKKTPLAVVGILANFWIWLLASSAVAIELIFMLIPWSLGWIDEINIMLARVLFWFFGHPLVYFWLLPAYIMYYVMLPKLAGGKLYSDFAGRLVFMLFILFSIPVGLHHQFAEPGVSQDLKLLHSIFTFGVAVPSLLTAFTIAASLEYAGVKNGAKGLFDWMIKLPYFSKENYLFPYLILGLFIFIFGGITGVVNASYSLNMVVHNTAWMPGHFHMTVGGPVLLAILGMSLHMAATLSGKDIKYKGWNVAVPYLWTIGIVFFSSGLMFGGLLGEPRRTNMGMSYLNPDSEFYRPDWILSTYTTVIGGIIMSFSAVTYFVVFFATLFSKKVRETTISFPTAEAYHDETNIGFVKNFTPWLIVAGIIVAIAYTPALSEAVENTGKKAPAWVPNNPVPIDNSKDEPY